MTPIISVSVVFYCRLPSGSNNMRIWLDFWKRALTSSIFGRLLLCQKSNLQDTRSRWPPGRKRTRMSIPWHLWVTAILCKNWSSCLFRNGGPTGMRVSTRVPSTEQGCTSHQSAPSTSCGPLIQHFSCLTSCMTSCSTFHLCVSGLTWETLVSWIVWQWQGMCLLRTNSNIFDSSFTLTLSLMRNSTRIQRNFAIFAVFLSGLTSELTSILLWIGYPISRCHCEIFCYWKAISVYSFLSMDIF